MFAFVVGIVLCAFAIKFEHGVLRHVPLWRYCQEREAFDTFTGVSAVFGAAFFIMGLVSYLGQ